MNIFLSTCFLSLLFILTGSEVKSDENQCNVQFVFINDRDTVIVSMNDIQFVKYKKNECILSIDSIKAAELIKVEFNSIIKSKTGKIIPGGILIKFNDSIAEIAGILDYYGSEMPPDIYCETFNRHFKSDSNQVVFSINYYSEYYDKTEHVFGEEIYQCLKSEGKVY